MITNSKKIVAALLVVVVIGTTVPSLALAQSTGYQPQSTRELIAYLLGRIEQLQEMQRLLQNDTSRRVNNTASFDYVTVNTEKADNINAFDAVLRGEVHLFGKAAAPVWFDYGQDEDFLDFKTSKYSVRSAYDRAIRTQVRYLKEDERYYFRIVAQDKNGTLIYGDIFGFRTDESD